MAGEYRECACNLFDTHVYVYMCMCQGMCVCVLQITYDLCACCTYPAAITWACKLLQTTAKPTAKATTQQHCMQCSTWLLRAVGEACPPTSCSVYVCMLVCVCLTICAYDMGVYVCTAFFPPTVHSPVDCCHKQCCMHSPCMTGIYHTPPTPMARQAFATSGVHGIRL